MKNIRDVEYDAGMVGHSKTCARCNEAKVLAEFYKKGDGHDCYCKTCKRAERNARYRGHVGGDRCDSSVSKPPGAEVSRQPIGPLIELESSGVPHKPDGIDWSGWERDYCEKLGVELSEADKREIRATVPAFFGLLAQIDKRVRSNEQ